MVSLSQSRWAVRAITALVWALAMASALYWGLKSSAPGPLRTGPAQAAPATSIDPLAVARILGAPSGAQTVPQASLASRFSLQGVVAGSPGGGAALIAVDGKPATPFRVGSTIEDGLVLKATSTRSATLAISRDAPALLTLEMPQLSQ